jgi:hypothetical protein
VHAMLLTGTPKQDRRFHGVGVGLLHQRPRNSDG